MYKRQDIYGHPALILRIEMPRAIYRQGRISNLFLAGATLCIVVAAAFVMLWLLEKFVVSRLEGLSSSVASIAASSDLSARVSFSGRDEITSLASGINRMLESLQVCLLYTSDCGANRRVRMRFESALLLRQCHEKAECLTISRYANG